MKLPTEVSSDDDCLQTVMDMGGELEDLVATIDAKDYSQAVIEAQQVKESLAAIERYLTEKAKES